jgi:hypothetical protein
MEVMMADWVKCIRRSNGREALINLDAVATIQPQDNGGSAITFMVTDSSDARPIAMRMRVNESPEEIMSADRERPSA